MHMTRCFSTVFCAVFFALALILTFKKLKRSDLIVCVVSFVEFGSPCPLQHHDRTLCLVSQGRLKAFLFWRHSSNFQIVSNRIGMKFDRIVLQVNMRRLTESDFRYMRYSFKMAAMMSFQAEKCCHLLSTCQLLAILSTVPDPRIFAISFVLPKHKSFFPTGWHKSTT